MPDIAGLLKAEIVRLSKKTIRQHMDTVQRASAAHRRDIAALKKQIATLEKRVAMLQKSGGKIAQAKVDSIGTTDAGGHRFVPKGLRSLRTRLGISQQELGMLVGVSSQSVYNWERQAAKPRPSQVAAIATLRSMGKREARRKLDELAAQQA